MVNEAALSLRRPTGSFESRRGNVANNVVFGIAAQVLQMGTSLFLLPVVIAMLPAAEVGLWYVFMTVQTLVYLVDFGFIPTFSRNFNYVFAGADRIEEHGLPPASKGHIDLVLLRSLLSTSRNIYAWMTLATAVGLSVFGTIYIASLIEKNPVGDSVWIDWAIFVATLVGHTYFQWQVAVLNGADRIRETYENAIISRCVQVGASIVGLMVHPTLTTLLLAYALSAVVMRVHLYFCMKDILTAVNAATKGVATQHHLLPALWRNTYRYGLVLLSSFLVSRFSLLVIASSFGVVVSASYSIASQALYAVVGVSHVLATMTFPKIIQAKVRGDFETTKSLLALCLSFMWTVVSCGAVALVLIGPYLLSLLKEGAQLPPVGILALMGIGFLIESTLQMLTSVITADNKIPFVWSYLVSGLVVSVGSVVVGTLGLGLEWLLLLQIAVQLSYNAWRWPRMALRDSHLALREIPHYAVKGALLVLHRADDPDGRSPSQ